MRRDPTEFRKRFARWKEGKDVYQAGRVLQYKDGKLTPYDSFVQQIGPVLYQELLRTSTPNIDAAYDNMMRQLAYESDYGRSRIAREQHNYGGYGWDGKTYTTFKDDADFVKHYVNLMNNRYIDAVNAADTTAYGQALKDKGYYEDSVENYVRNLNGMKSLSRSAVNHRQNNAELYQLSQTNRKSFAQPMSIPKFTDVVPQDNTRVASRIPLFKFEDGKATKMNNNIMLLSTPMFN